MHFSKIQFNNFKQKWLTKKSGYAPFQIKILCKKSLKMYRVSKLNLTHETHEKYSGPTDHFSHVGYTILEMLQTKRPLVFLN